jgi:hypothetical protein
MAKKRKRRVSPQVAITSDKAHKKVIKDRLKELMEIVQKKQEKELTKILLHLGKLLKKREELRDCLFPLDEVRRIMDERKDLKVGFLKKILKKDKVIEVNKVFLKELVTNRYLQAARQACKNFLKKYAKDEKDEYAMALAISFIEAEIRGFDKVKTEQNPFLNLALEVSKMKAKKGK